LERFSELLLAKQLALKYLTYENSFPRSPAFEVGGSPSDEVAFLKERRAGLLPEELTP